MTRKPRRKPKKKTTTTANIATYPDRLGSVIRRPVPKVDKDYEEWLLSKKIRRRRP